MKAVVHKALFSSAMIVLILVLCLPVSVFSEETEKQTVGNPVLNNAESTETSAPKPTEKPTPEPTEKPTPGPTEKPTPEPTEKPTPERTEKPAPEPTEKPTPEPTEKPTPEPTEKPTPEPTEQPSSGTTTEVTNAPTDSPSPGVTDNPLPEPTNTVTPDTSEKPDETIIPKETPSTTESPEPTPAAPEGDEPGTTPSAAPDETESPEITPEPSVSPAPSADAPETEVPLNPEELFVRLLKPSSTLKAGETAKLPLEMRGGTAPYTVKAVVRLDDEEILVDEREYTSAEQTIAFYVEKGGKYSIEVRVTDSTGSVKITNMILPVSVNKIESKAAWERSMEGIVLTGDFAVDIVNIAKTQVGYTESTVNFVMRADGTIDGYTRYGDYIHSPYADWCAAFISFVVDYANLPFSGQFHSANVGTLMDQAKALGAYHNEEDYVPQPGDVVFLEVGGNARGHIGIIESISGDLLQTIEGNVSNRVVEKGYLLHDDVITGFFSMKDMMEKYGRESQQEMDAYYGALKEPVMAHTSKTKVNVRQQATVNANNLQVIEKKGTEVLVMGIAIGSDGKEWYAVKTEKVDGFIRSDLVDLPSYAALTGNESEEDEEPEEIEEEEEIIEEPPMPAVRNELAEDEEMLIATMPEAEIEEEEVVAGPAVIGTETDAVFGSVEQNEEDTKIAEQEIVHIEETKVAEQEIVHTEETDNAPQQDELPADESDVESEKEQPHESLAETGDEIFVINTNNPENTEKNMPAPENMASETEDEAVDEDRFFFDTLNGEDQIEEQVYSGEFTTLRVRHGSMLVSWKVSGLVAVHDITTGRRIIGLSQTGESEIEGLEAGKHVLMLTNVTLDNNILIYEDAFETITVEVK